MNSYSVYEHICPNGKIYIGITARKPEIKYKSNDRNFGYNNSSGGEFPSTGVHRVISEETRKKISETQKGKVIPPEIIKKMHDNRKGWKNPEEVRQKISNAAKIPVIQYDLDHNIIKEYESILCASIETNVAKQNICKCCKGERQRAGGFIWKYKIAGSSHKKVNNIYRERHKNAT